MLRNSLGSILHYVQRKARVAGLDKPSDTELLDRFVGHRDEAAFQLLVCRHGPLVLGLCRRLLRHEQDTEDAFQATFLALVRKAGAIGNKEALASWLYKVAYRIACRAGARPAALTNQDAVNEMQAPDREADVIWRDLRSVLDHEVARLPEPHRRAIILCYLEGKTNEEAARFLGCPKGTVAARLARAHDRLRRRLTQRGLALSSAALATVLGDKALSAAVPSALIRSTVSAGLAYASGTTAGVVSVKAVAMTEGVLRMMWYSKMKMLPVAFLAVILGGTGVGLIVRHAWAGAGPDTSQESQADPASTGDDAKKEMAALRAELINCRTELELALKEIKGLKDVLRLAAPRDQGPFYRGKPVAFWLEQFKDTDPKFRTEAVEALGTLAEKNKELIPVLVDALKERYVGSLASNHLASLGPEIVPVLVDVLKEKASPTSLRNAAEALRRLGPEAKPAVPHLVKALRVDDWEAQDSIVETLGSIGPDAKPAIPALVEVLGVSLKKLEVAAKQRKMSVDQFVNRPVSTVNAMVKIDPEIQEILPRKLSDALYGPNPSRQRITFELCQQAYEALSKRYTGK